MARRVLPATVLTVLALAGCSRMDRAERPAWRGEAEAVCLAEHRVAASPVVQPAAAIEGPGICGVDHPFKVYALAGGSVRLDTPSLLDCPMIAALDTWIADVVQPRALARFGEPVVRIDTMGTYACRGINNEEAKLSEHAFANAIDVGGFVLASGRRLNVRLGWSGADPQEAAFLHEAHAGACGPFTTVLGPGSNVFHYNHVHADLARHGESARGPRTYCKPEPRPEVDPPNWDAPQAAAEPDAADATGSIPSPPR